MEIDESTLSTLLGMVLVQNGGTILIAKETMDQFTEMKYIGIELDPESNEIKLQLVDKEELEQSNV